MDNYYQEKNVQACIYQNYDKYMLYHCNVDPYGYWYPVEYYPCEKCSRLWNGLSQRSGLVLNNQDGGLGPILPYPR